MTVFEHLLYGLLWLSFGWGHSALADEAAKRRLSAFAGAKYRLLYNLVAAIHIAAVMFGGQAVLGEHATRFDWPPEIATALTSAKWAAMAFLIAALTQYDLGRFSGFTQLKTGRREPQLAGDEPLHLTGIHRYVRHPLYAGAYLYLWSGVHDEFHLATALWGSLYLAIGTYFEERRLLRLYGKAYAGYRAAVPALIPWKGRAL